MIAAEIANLPVGSNQYKMGSTDVPSTPVTKEQAAKQLGTTPKAITQACVIKEYAPEEAFKVAARKETLESAGQTVNRRNRRIILKARVCHNG